MARELNQIIAELRQKMELMASQRDIARQECAALANRVEALEDRLEQCQNDLRSARMEVDFLTVSHHAETPDNLISARRRVQRLISKIDKCVALIKEDADIN